MVVPEAFVEISQERLNEIAMRRLLRLGIAAKPGPTGALEGELSFQRVVNPATQAQIPGALFRVISHDQLACLAPAPLPGLPPVFFHDVQSLEQLEQRVIDGLAVRVQGAQAVAVQMQRLKLVPRLDPDRLLAVTEAHSGPQAFQLEGDHLAVHVAAVRSGSGWQQVTGPACLIDLTSFSTLVDLELELSVRSRQLQPVSAGSSASAVSSSAAPAQQRPPPFVAVASDVGGPASLLSRFSSHLRITQLQIVEELSDGQQKVRAAATLVSGTTFRVRIDRPDGAVVFEDKVDLARVPSLAHLVNTVQGRSAEAPRIEEKAAAIHIAPHPGEVWLMQVVVEREENGEVRYVLVDVDGRAFGASRLLKCDDFYAVFHEKGGGYRLRIRIDEVHGQRVVYRQLNAAGQASPEQRAMPLQGLVASFVPEAVADQM